jgi:O-antigen ligase
MNIILGTIAFLTLPLGMVAGLSLASTISGFLVLFLGHQALNPLNKVQRDVIWLKNARILKILATLFLGWCFMACFWSPDIIKSLQTFVVVVFFIAMSIAVAPLPKHKRQIIEIAFFWGFIFAILLFIVEYHTDGVLSKTFRSIFQPDRVNFVLYMLDRGCSFLSLSAWVVIGCLLNKNKKITALLVYLFILGLLFVSDSFASFVGFTLGAITFGVLSFDKRAAVGIVIAMFAYCFAMPIVSKTVDPMAIATDVESLPFSSKHRIFIWHFTAEKVAEKKLFGHGFDSSRYIGEHDTVAYDGRDIALLPLHPHNSVMQVLVETGAPGLLIYALLLCTIFITMVHHSKNMVSAACFINYLFIGAVSFGLWQIWWIASAAFIFAMMKLLVESEKTTT